MYKITPGASLVNNPNRPAFNVRRKTRLALQAEREKPLFVPGAFRPSDPLIFPDEKPLGTNYEITSRFFDDVISKTEEKQLLDQWALQDLAGRILADSPGKHRVCRCCRSRRAGVEKIQVIKGKNKSYFGGVQRCGSVWVCPVCARKITEYRRLELTAANSRWLGSGGGLLMLTLTVPHSFRDELLYTLEGIGDAFEYLFRHRKFKTFLARLGYAGKVRVLEDTHGRNGWHPHFHVLLYFDRGFYFDCKGLAASLLPQWQKACGAVGLPIPNEHGLSVQDGTQASEYVSKWGIEHEMTKGHLKRARRLDSVSAFGLLDLVHRGLKKAAVWFREHAFAMRGKHQLSYSRGLREKLGMNIELTDQEIADADDDIKRKVDSILYEDWKIILKKGARAQVLKAHFDDDPASFVAMVNAITGKNYIEGDFK